MSVRIMMLEVRRGAGAPLTAAFAGGGLALAMIAGAAGDWQGPWSGSVPGVLYWLNSIGLLLGPVAAAAGAWAGSRERRKQVGELLAAVPRARWQRDGASLVALILAMSVGLVVVLSAVVVSVLPTLSYGGGRWPLSVLLLILGYAVCVLLGFAAGRLAPTRWTAPVIALVVYVACGIPTYSNSGIGQLAPAGNLPAGDGQRLHLAVAAQAAVWLAGSALCLFLLASARRKWWSLIPAGAAIAVAVPLAALPHDWNGNAYTAAWTEPDPKALAQVCTTDAGPRVCLTRVHERLLPAVTDVVRPILAEMPAGSFAAEEGLVHPAYKPTVIPGRLLIPFLQGQAAPFSTELRDRDETRAQIVNSLFGVWCSDRGPSAERAYGTAMALFPEGTAVAPGDRLAVRLAADTRARRAWIARYLEASASCDMPAFDKLVAA